MTRAALGLVVVVAACSGGGTKRSAPPPKPGAHADRCYWAGHLSVTLAPMHGDATCIQPRPVEVELRPEAKSTELGLVVIDPPATIGKTDDGVNVSVQGELELCPATLSMSWSDPRSETSWFANVSVEQDRGTRRVAGVGFAAVSCIDDSCRQCEAQVSVDGAIRVD